ncbi:hypothetical protein GNI_011760 [Gregarina niphandrodes]|uniref:Uncharacterized protein n=1 Tax=Gregarina niphandrodes TaxID=110365 RepID=A0A023BCT8_GRENI|nr:hypothetical protein GNI_011760 [Gregarina niphandrodes]EZG85431.1 hypothetical protein GNI_011760 [Gregarina niphandrodes]|eukprot:XP_011128827.1 hypothetical protein GNI_011760 [Gregarina niphandrodes]
MAALYLLTTYDVPLMEFVAWSLKERAFILNKPNAVMEHAWKFGILQDHSLTQLKEHLEGHSGVPQLGASPMKHLAATDLATPPANHAFLDLPSGGAFTTTGRRTDSRRPCRRVRIKGELGITSDDSLGTTAATSNTCALDSNTCAIGSDTCALISEPTDNTTLETTGCNSGGPGHGGLAHGGPGHGSDHLLRRAADMTPVASDAAGHDRRRRRPVGVLSSEKAVKRTAELPTRKRGSSRRIPEKENVTECPECGRRGQSIFDPSISDREGHVWQYFYCRNMLCPKGRSCNRYIGWAIRPVDR